jgi:glycolate oxidase
MEDSANAVTEIISSGIIPAGLEIMDKLTIQAVEVYVKAGYPVDAGAILIVELDGLKDDMNRIMNKVVEICKNNYAKDIKLAKNESQRELLWKGRTCSYASMGLIGKYYHLDDGTVPRKNLTKIFQNIGELTRKYGLKVACVSHAGDGNIHPIILYDTMKLETLAKVKSMSSEITRLCVEYGGSITGEHGVGLEKVEYLPLIYNEDDLEVMRKIKKVFDPLNLCNPGKKIPLNHSGNPLFSKYFHN